MDMRATGRRVTGDHVRELVVDPHQLAFETAALLAVTASDPAAQVGKKSGQVVHEHGTPRVVGRPLGCALERRDLVNMGGDVVPVDEDVQAVGWRRLPVGDLAGVKDGAEPGVALEPLTGVEGTDESERVGGGDVPVFNLDLARVSHLFFYGTGRPFG